MTTDVVGLRYVQEGLSEVLQGQQQYLKSLSATVQGMKVVVDRTNQNAKSLDRLTRDVVKAENEIRRLAQALYRGAIEGGQFQGEVNRIAARLRALGLDRAQSETMRYARAQATLARETEQAGNAIAQQGAQIQTAMRGQAAATMFASRAQNASGMAMQQVGYQVGDFLVQVQSGTNAMVAFGQQATQLVGVLPMFGSILGVSGAALIGLSAGLGIAIPLVTAIGATIMRARENAGDAEAAFKSLGDTLGRLDDVRLDSLNKGIAEGARDAAREYERVLNLMERVELRALQSILRGQSRVVEEMIKNQRTLQNLAAQTDTDFDFEVLGLGSFNEAIFLAAQLRTLTGETREELLQQVTAIEEALTLRGLMNPQVEALIAKLAEEVGLAEAARDAVEAQNEAIDESESGLDRAADSGRNLADALREANAAMQSLSGFSAGLDRALAVSVAKVEALRRGANAAVAGSIAGMRVELESRADRLVQSGMDRGMVEQMVGPEREKINQLFRSEQERARLQESSRGGGGGGAAREQEDYLAGLLAEAEQKRRLVGLSEEETRRREILFELKKRELPLDDARIEQIIKTEAETRKLIEAERQREQLMQTIEGNIKSAFMTMVDGSASVEDAFRNMLRNIVLAIYEQQVATPAATAIGGLLNTAVGSLFGPGMTTGTPLTIPSTGVDSLLPSFDGGGFTGYGPRSGGMDGRGGFPAMLHPRETVIDHAKGQATGSVTVNQYFSIAANGDDSVRRIVRQEAPRIAEQAKAAVVDAKRRGGSYGRSF